MKILKRLYGCLATTLFIILILIGTVDRIYAAPELYGIDVSGPFFTIDPNDGTETLIGTVPEEC